MRFSSLTYQTKKDLKVHVDWERENQLVEDEALKCRHCIITCSDKEVLRKHLKREHTLECTICSNTFEGEINLGNHEIMKTIHDYSYTRGKYI